MLVHVVKARQHGAELLGADGDHRRQPDRRVHRVAAADPVPEPEHVLGVDAEGRHLVRVGGHGHEVPADGALVSERVERPLAGRPRVGHRLERRERLRRDDEQRLGGVEIARGLGEVGAVHVRDEAESQVARAVVLQRLVGHDRTEIGAADADVDDGAHAPAGVPAPAAVPDLVGERGHPIEHRVHVRDDVLAIEDDRRVIRRAQRDVEHGTPLRRVDVLAAEHRLDVLAQSARLARSTRSRIVSSVMRFLE